MLFVSSFIQEKKQVELEKFHILFHICALDVQVFCLPYQGLSEWFSHITDTSLGPQPIFRLNHEESDIIPETENFHTIVSIQYPNSLQLN